jgi:Cdc6-like AAA superfamily ATPase
MPDKYNPFQPNKMAGPGMFRGRLAELAIIDQCLVQTKHGNSQHFLIQGERGIGKSSILLVQKIGAAGRLETYTKGENVNFLVVSISLQEKDTFYSIIKKIASGLEREINSRKAVKVLALSALSFISRFEAFGVRYHAEKAAQQELELFDHLVSDIINITKALPDGLDGLLLLIDEADKPAANAGLGLICKTLTEALTREGCDRLCIGLAGLPDLLDKLRASHESSPRLFRTMELGPLTPREREQVLTIGLEDALQENGFAVSMTDDAKNLISNMSEGYPHFLQEFAYCAFEQDDDNVIDDEDVKQSLYQENGAFDQLGRKYFDRYYQAPQSDDYRKVLDTMSDHFDKWITRAQIIAESGLRPGIVDHALRFLKTKAVISQHENKVGQYRLPTRSFAIWIKATKREGSVSAITEADVDALTSP